MPTAAQDPDHLTVHAQTVPDKPAVIDPDGPTVTYGELEELANRLADGLRGLGLRAGDRVVWCGPNSVEVITVLHAARKAGLVAVPLAYRFTAEEMRYVIADSGASVVLVDAEYAERVAAVRNELPGVEEVVVFGGEPFAGARAIADLCAAGSPEPVGVPTDGAAR
ncbi:AMP-binding protein [Actinomycetes bacterium KLBMP 9759]